MDFLYPVNVSPTDKNKSAAENADSITVLVNCSVCKNDKMVFLENLRAMLEDFEKFDGTCGSKTFECEKGDNVEISVLHKFASMADHDKWRASPEFDRWLKAVEPYASGAAHVRRYSGMEPLFVSPNAPSAPPRWKMLIILMLAVYPMSIAIALFIVPALESMNMLLAQFITSFAIAWLMTYAIVPALTKLFQNWLTPKS